MEPLVLAITIGALHRIEIASAEERPRGVGVVRVRVLDVGGFCPGNLIPASLDFTFEALVLLLEFVDFGKRNPKMSCHVM